MGKIRKPRRLAAVLATLILATTLGTITATQQTAHAARWQDCTGYGPVLCLYNWVNGSSYRTVNYPSNNLGRFILTSYADGECVKFRGPAAHINDKASSAYLVNAGSRRLTLYNDMDCNGGGTLTMGGTKWTRTVHNLNRVNVGGAIVSRNDMFSSFKLS